MFPKNIIKNININCKRTRVYSHFTKYTHGEISQYNYSKKSKTPIDKKFIFSEYNLPDPPENDDFIHEPLQEASLAQMKKEMEKIDSDPVFHLYEKEIADMKEKVWRDTRVKYGVIDEVSMDVAREEIERQKHWIQAKYQNMTEEEKNGLVAELNSIRTDPDEEMDQLDVMYESLTGKRLRQEEVSEEELNQFFQFMDSEAGIKFANELDSVLDPKDFDQFREKSMNFTEEAKVPAPEPPAKESLSKHEMENFTHFLHKQLEERPELRAMFDEEMGPGELEKMIESFSKTAK